MNEILIRNRLELLFDVLVFCSDFRQIFTLGERIMINQERARWMHFLENEYEDPWLVSETIEQKISEVQRLKSLYKFHNLKKDPLNDEQY